MKNFNVIQIVLYGISIIAIVAGVVLFSTYTGRGGSSKTGGVLMWGTIPEPIFTETIQQMNSKEAEGLKYVEKSPETIESDLLKAIAEGKGPDLVLLNEKQVLSNRKRMKMISFDTFPLRNYQDLFFDEASLLVGKEGLLGFPFLVDPLVLYYNKDILANAGFSKVPETWAEVLSVTPVLTEKDSSFNISKSAIALGSYDNIRNSKDIYWTLVLQAGNPVIKREVNPQSGEEVYGSIFADSLNYTLNPAYAATNFFTQFSNPTKTVYTWNRSLPDSQNMFVSGDLAFYIGKASELQTIKKLNPNLNFDVAIIPQSQSSTRKVTYGSMYVLAIPRAASNVNGAVKIISFLTSKDTQTFFFRKLGIASTRRDLLASPDLSSLYEKIFNRSAIMTQGILEPDVSKTDDIIKELIDNVVSGRNEVSEAVSNANNKLMILLENE